MITLVIALIAAPVLAAPPAPPPKPVAAATAPPSADLLDFLGEFGEENADTLDAFGLDDRPSPRNKTNEPNRGKKDDHDHADDRTRTR